MSQELNDALTSYSQSIDPNCLESDPGLLKGTYDLNTLIWFLNNLCQESFHRKIFSFFYFNELSVFTMSNFIGKTNK